jgi:endogenous inhibitor of DNA gyrase (YacG/DUF329 family)
MSTPTRDSHCSDCSQPLTAENAFHPYGDCHASRCKSCDRAAWARIDAKAATQPGMYGNTITNVWD